VQIAVENGRPVMDEGTLEVRELPATPGLDQAWAKAGVAEVHYIHNRQRPDRQGNLSIETRDGRAIVELTARWLSK
jgi:hypothetical protein